MNLFFALSAKQTNIELVFCSVSSCAVGEKVGEKGMDGRNGGEGGQLAGNLVKSNFCNCFW